MNDQEVLNRMCEIAGFINKNTCVVMLDDRYVRVSIPEHMRVVGGETGQATMSVLIYALMQNDPRAVAIRDVAFGQIAELINDPENPLLVAGAPPEEGEGQVVDQPVEADKAA